MKKKGYCHPHVLILKIRHPNKIISHLYVTHISSIRMLFVSISLVSFECKQYSLYYINVIQTWQLICFSGRKTLSSL